MPKDQEINQLSQLVEQVNVERKKQVEQLGQENDALNVQIAGLKAEVERLAQENMVVNEKFTETTTELSKHLV